MLETIVTTYFLKINVTSLPLKIKSVTQLKEEGKEDAGCWIVTIMRNQLLHDRIMLCECRLLLLLPLTRNSTHQGQ